MEREEPTMHDVPPSPALYLHVYRARSGQWSGLVLKELAQIPGREYPLDVAQSARGLFPNVVDLPGDDELEALRRLIRNAKGDTGQSRRCADFLLAWWNAGTCGSFDLTTLWGVDRAIADDMMTVFGLVARVQEYPPALDPAFADDFAQIIAIWRPELSE